MDNSILVSCVMPTRGRLELARKAVDCWRSQTYANTELLILDDDDEPSFPGGLDDSRIWYKANLGRWNIPQKLNQLCAAAKGEVIVRFDDDDWSAPRRIEDQLQRLLDSGLGVSGYHAMVFVDESGNCRKYVNDRNAYALGTSLMFLKSFWAEHPFDEMKSLGSDNAFGRVAREAHQLVTADPGELMFARAHSSNSNEKRMNAYQRVQPNECAFVLEVESLPVLAHSQI